MMMEDLFESGDAGDDMPPPPKPKKAAKAKAQPDAADSPEASAEAKAELIVAEAQANPVALFTDPKRYSEFYERVKEAVSGQEPDLTTDKGRKAIAALAFRVTKSKTALDKAGLELTAEWRGQIKAVNEARFKMVEELDVLAAEVRQPLTDWEKKEEARQAEVQADIDRLRQAAAVGEEEDAAAVEARGRALFEEALDADKFGERLDEAQAAKDAAVRALSQAMHRMRQEEADRAELARLRAAEEERMAREAKEREEQEAREAEERRQAEVAEAERVRQEAEAKRLQEAEERAAQAARDEAARISREAEEAREREHQAELAKERERVLELERQETARQAEAARLEELNRQRLDEESRRQADQEHRSAIQAEAAKAIEAAIGKQLPKEALAQAAERVVLAIAAGNVPHVSIKF